MKKYNYIDDFEMLYLRHDYFKKVKKIDIKGLNKFKKIANITGMLMFRKYQPHFEKVSFAEEDVISIANIYTLHYLSLYSMRNNHQIKKRFIRNYKQIHRHPPNWGTIEQKDRDCLISFLRQKLLRCSILCVKKARDIVVDKEKRLWLAKTKDSINLTDYNNLIPEYKKYGYRKVTGRELKEAKLNNKNFQSKIFDKNGFEIIEVQTNSKSLTEEEYRNIFTENNSMFNNTPENLLINAQENKIQNEHEEKFYNMTSYQKANTLLRFISQNKNNPKLALEVCQAKKMLKNIKSVV